MKKRPTSEPEREERGDAAKHGFPAEADDPFIPDEEPVVLPVEEALDLHAFRPGDVKFLVPDYLDEAVRMGFREVRIIHGKGMGALRRTVSALLARHPRVLSWHEAEPDSGGWGATRVFLKADDEP